MAHGYPDYGLAAALQNIYAIVDLGELAARLGAVSVFSRAGSTLFQDTFDSGLGKWSIGKGSANVHADVKVGLGILDAVCADLVIDAAGASYVGLDCVRAFPYTTPVGLEASFWPANDVSYVRLTLRTERLTWYGLIQAFYYIGDGKVTIAGPDSVEHVLGYLPPGGLTNEWITMKVTADLLAGKGKLLRVNSYSYDLSGYTDLRVNMAFMLDVMRWNIYAFGPGAPVGHCYVEDVVVTINEP